MENKMLKKNSPCLPLFIKEGDRGSSYKAYDLTKRMQAVLPRPIMDLIKYIGRMAEKEGLASFAVGGMVRDILQGLRNFDLDIVIEKDAIKFAELLTKKLRGTLVVHRKFGTATIYTDWPKGVLAPPLAGPKLKIDLATARRERYERPAALPTVEFASLKEDLYRRDFTINAMAISLTKENFGQVIDFFEGIRDLKMRRIRALHAKSFIDDPTRIFRAIRFEQRLSFKIDPYTENLIREAVGKKMFDKTGDQRIRDEIILILKEREPYKALGRMDELDELEVIHKDIRLNKRVEKMFISCYDNYLWYVRHFPERRPLDLYVMYLMALTDMLSLRDVETLCERFVFRRSDRLRLISYKKCGQGVLKRLGKQGIVKASKIYSLLKPLSHETILACLARAENKLVTRRIKAFIKRYGDISIHMTGHDLMAYGLKAGPHFKDILGKILAAKIDGMIATRKDEREYLRKLVH
ncbi:MAG: hypothetical protein PHS37_05750 [Candidatus Omnitrophica bacterium]|nr:hypothetical protein [Candidatus Omnitrophota bacterium]